MLTMFLIAFDVVAIYAAIDCYLTYRELKRELGVKR